MSRTQSKHLEPHVGAMVDEFEELFPKHRFVLDGSSVAIHDPARMIYVALHFHSMKVVVNCYRLNRRHQEIHDLMEPGSVEKIAGVSARHLNCEIPLDWYK